MSLRLRQTTGVLWLALGATFLAIDIFELVNHEFFLGWSYYLVVWPYFVLCIVGGAFLFGSAPMGRWLVTVLAVLLALYGVMLWGKAEGAPLWAQLWCASMVAFAVWSIFLVQRRNA